MIEIEIIFFQKKNKLIKSNNKNSNARLKE